jgi:hypothetical protein
VSAVTEGVALYKQAKESFMEVKSAVDEVVGVANEVRGFWAKLFGAKANPVAQAARKKEKYVAVDEAVVMSNIVTQLSTFFRLQDQLANLLREQEEKSKTVYDPDANLMEAALHRIMAQDQMAALEVEIREAMVYAPKEMGALYSRTFQMRDVIKAEQDKARKKRDDESWQRKEKERLLNERQAYLLATFLFLLYMWILLGLLSRIGK